jgi:hypothetical protein
MACNLGSYKINRNIGYVIRIEVLSNSPMVEMTRRKYECGKILLGLSVYVKLFA